MSHEISIENIYGVLREISASIHTGTRVKDVLDIVARKSVEALNAEGAVIRILNRETYQLELCTAYGASGLGERLLSHAPISTEDIIADLCSAKKVVIIRDILNDPRVQYPKGTWVVAKKSAEALNAEGGVIRILDGETYQLELFAAYGASGLGERLLSHAPISTEDIITDLCSAKKVVVIRDILNDPRVQYPKEAWAEGFRMAIDAPLTIGSDTLGTLRIYFSDQREFSEEELKFVTFIAEQVAFAIDRAKLIEEQQSRYDHLALQTEKLSAMGRMAAGIAHEINNPLASILLFSSNMLKKVPQEGPFKERLELIVQEAIRCKRIIQELLEFSRESEPHMTMANVNEIVDKALHILENEFRLRHIAKKRELLTEIPKTLLDQDQIEQVFVNLLLNALQAIEDRGTITVRTYLNSDGDRVKCEIADTGCGIPPEHMSRIFEPFFSTKPKGTGLGLAVSYGIIQKHGGRIQASSGPGGKGTTFTVEIPVASEAPSTKMSGT